MTNDSPIDFLGAEIYGVSITNACLVTEKAPDIYEGSVMYVNIETSEGTLQFTAYNEHNGYYSHTALVESPFLCHKEYL